MNIAQAWLGKDESYLVDLDNQHRLHPAVVQAFTQMQAAATEQGIDCQLVSSYRNFERQLSIWNRKWRGELPIYNAEGKLLKSSALSNEQKLHGILTWSAIPGGSRHHWGTDIDVFDKASVEQWQGDFELVDSEYRQGGPCHSLACWLDNNASRFGFERPFLSNNGGVAVELWHLSHIPTAYAFEQARCATQLKTVLLAAEIEGKATILEHFDCIYQRYVLNKGVAS